MDEEDQIKQLMTPREVRLYDLLPNTIADLPNPDIQRQEFEDLYRNLRVLVSLNESK